MVPSDPLEELRNPGIEARVLRDILVPGTLVRDPAAFGGVASQDCLRGDLIIRGTLAVELQSAPVTKCPRMLVPALVEPHCHLDKCHSIDRMDKVGGDLGAALEAQRKDKARWTAKDLRHRMSRGLSELVSAGCYAVRSHIDWGEKPAPPLAWSVLNDIAQEKPGTTVQAAALTAISQLADHNFCFETAKHIAATPGGVLGSFVLHHDHRDIERGLKNAFAAADRFGLPLDFHVDEGLGDYNGLELICDAARETGFEGPVLCGHAVSLIERTDTDLARLLDKLLNAGITICALPTTNLYLQGRHGGTPDRRGLTRLQELNAAGVPIAVGSDNVADAFCPMGQHDPRAALHLGSLAAHLDPPMGQWWPAITLNPARAMGLAAPYIEETPVQNLRLCEAANTADLTSARRPLVPLSASNEA